MAMVVQCTCCLTEYRLDEALLKGAKGACIRCPKCRERIIVANPQPRPVVPPIMHQAPPQAVPPIVPMVPPPVPPRIEPPAASTPSPPKVPPIVPPDTVSDPSDIPGRKALRLEDLFIHPSAVEGDRIPGGGNYGKTATRPLASGWKPPPRPPLYRRPLFLVLAISILLLAGGTFYFVDGNSSRRPLDSVIPARTRSIPENSVLDVGNLKGYLNRTSSGETFYVVKGTVTNIGKALSNGIRVEAILLGNDNQAIVKSGVFAGNVIDDSLIPHMSRVGIEGWLGMRFGDGDVNRDIPDGKTLPFMVVFFDPPEGVESFRVKAIDAEEVDRIVSPAGKKPGGPSNPK